MSEWITAREAAEILGVHISAVPKMIRRGDLTPRERRPKLRRTDVVALAEVRSRPPDPKPQKPAPCPPDDEHDWLDAHEAAAFMGVGREAVRVRARRGKLPSEVHDGRVWFRRDQLEVVKRADAVERAGRVSVLARSVDVMANSIRPAKPAPCENCGANAWTFSDASTAHRIGDPTNFRTCDGCGHLVEVK